MSIRVRTSSPLSIGSRPSCWTTALNTSSLSEVALSSAPAGAPNDSSTPAFFKRSVTRSRAFSSAATSGSVIVGSGLGPAEELHEPIDEGALLGGDRGLGLGGLLDELVARGRGLLEELRVGQRRRVGDAQHFEVLAERRLRRLDFHRVPSVER